MDNEGKYSLAISFDEERRLQTVKQFIKSNEAKFSRNPSSMIKLIGRDSTDKRVVILVMLLVLMLWMSKERIFSI
jgi:hypothetical protein